LIVAHLTDPCLRSALMRARGADEDIVTDPSVALEAMERGVVRMVIQERSPAGGPEAFRVPNLVLTEDLLGRWEQEHRAGDVQAERVEFFATKLAHLTTAAGPPTWVDRLLADLSRAAGAPLPPALRRFSRRVLEFPSRYNDLYGLSETTGLSRGALKARFRRRGLDSPYAYLRWTRVLAVAEALSDPTVTVARAAYRAGFTSDGNLCRMVASVTGMTPTVLRTQAGRQTALIAFASGYLGKDALRAWAELDDLFSVAA